MSGLGRDEQDTAIVSSVIGLAHALGLEAVTEGVVTLEQLERLSVLGCDLAQGFNWRRPATSEDVDAWLTTGVAPSAPVRTLLVDDRAELRASIRVAMELDGHFQVVAEAADGREAIPLPPATSPTWSCSTWSCRA